MRVVIYGASSPHPALLMSVAERQGLYDFCGYIDDTLSGERWGMPILGGREKIAELAAEGYGFVNTISSSTRARYEVGRTIVGAGGNLVDLIYPETVKFEHGPGAYVQEGVHIQAGVTMGENCTVHLGAIVSHETIVGNSCFIGACTLAGRVALEDGVYVGIGAMVMPDVRVGRWATIGAGSLVRHDVPDYAVMVGSPARQIKENARLYDSGALT